MAILEGVSPQEKLEKSYLPGLKANWMLWPAVQAINFSVVPLQHRVLVVNIVSLGRYSPEYNVHGILLTEGPRMELLLELPEQREMSHFI